MIECPTCKKDTTSIRGYNSSSKGRVVRAQCKNKKCKTNFFRVLDTRTPARILYIDIETAPMKVMAFDNHPDFISHSMLVEDWYMLCFSVNWDDSDKVLSFTLTPKEAKERNDRRIVEKALILLDAADIVVHHNGKSFDEKKLNDRFITYGMKPPTQYRSVDTKLVWKRVAKASWNGQDFLSKKFGREGKIKTDISWWIECMKGNPEYLRKMSEYCADDILDLKENYKIIRAWDNQHPNLGVYSVTGNPCCTVCGSEDLEELSETYKTQTNTYKQYRCNNCGHIPRDRKTTKKSNVHLIG